MPQTTLITLTDPQSTAAEAFRTLRTNLMFSSLEHPLTTLLATSPAPDDEKSLTLANLAVSMAQGGRKTILVDCDLRRPTQHTLFGVAAQPGFTEALLSDNPAPALVSVGVENLSLLPAGSTPPNPADLLGSRRLQSLIATLQSQADIVLFDAPPLLAVSDAALLATKVDGVLLVVGAGKTQRDHAQRAKELLEKIHVRVVGAVLTNASGDGRMNKY
jgi:capsular exopolysaccharide synthesis family protein